MKKYLKHFGKTEKKELNFAFFCLLILGTFGVHQFYLANNKKALFLLSTTGVSHLLLFIFTTTSFFNSSSRSENIIMFLIGLGFTFGAPEWFVDLFTLPKQVKKINSENEIP